MIFNRCHLTLKKNLASLALSPIFLYITAVMQFLVLATFDKNLNILSLFDFHHIFLSYQCCSKHHNLAADLKTLPFVLADIFLITYFCRNVFPRPHYPAEISLSQLSFSEMIDSKYYPFSKFDVM